jgi:Family of unknown function (DUF6069)
MTVPMPRQDPEPEPTRKVDARALWSGGVATAVVAALIALVGILVCRWLFDVPILSPRREGAWGNASTVGYVFAAAACALVATALMYLLLISTPYPRVFFGWIIGLATVVAVVYPFSTTAPMSQKFATAVVNLVLGLAIGTLIAEVSRRATRRRVLMRRRYDRPTYPPPPPPTRTAGDGYP